MVKKKRSFQEVAAVAEPVTVEETISVNNLRKQSPQQLQETISVNNLRANLDENKAYDGVVGYILRNSIIRLNFIKVCP